MAFRFVYDIEVQPGEDEAFIESWREGSKVTQEYPGAVETRLYKKHGQEHTYTAIAEWESQEARQKAHEDIVKGESERALRVKQWRSNEEFGPVTIISELDEIVRVLPPTK